MRILEVMTPNPITLQASETVADAARAMREYDVGAVVIRKNEKLCGIVTDRDIVVRVLGKDRDPQETQLGAICSEEILAVSPAESTAEAVRLMRERAVRRLPVVENDDVIGIVSLGDLAVHLDRKSTLGEISAAPPNH